MAKGKPNAKNLRRGDIVGVTILKLKLTLKDKGA
jgi:hypothetical protein